MGCSETKNLSSIQQFPLITLNPIQTSCDTTSKQYATRNIENCILICLANSSLFTKHNDFAEKLRHIISTLRIFNNPSECITFIETIREEKIFLIISSDMEQTVRSVYYLPQLEKIYDFYESSLDITNIDDQFMQKKRFTNMNELCEQLREDTKFCTWDLINIIVVPAEKQQTNSSNFTKKQTAMFLCIQLIKQIAVRIKFENNHKSIFLDYCRIHYAQNNEQMHDIDDFDQNYRPKNVLWWITKPCFLSWILHRVLRTYEIDIIYKMGFVLKHIHTQLTLLHDNILSLIKDRDIVYLGKSMSNDEFDTLIKPNCDGLLSFSNFIETTIHKEHAIDFLRHRIMSHPKMTAVLFEICFDSTVNSTGNVCAMINNSNSNISSQEGKILFTLGTVFHIKSIIEETADNSMTIWIVRLTFVDDNDEHFYRLITPLRSNDVETNPLSYLGKLLIEMDACDRAEQFYLDLLNDPSVFGQPRRLARLHNGLGVIFTYKGEHLKALEHYEISLKTSLSYMVSDHPDLASIYKLMGDSCFNYQNYVQALEKYEQCAQLIKRNAQQIDQSFIDNLNNSIDKTKQLLESKK
ncbi:hypothetical protein I4U23_014956 [Adineta vaga]|nr:hypothetical protein I4U23_014956 [Adineta vaga]